MILLYKITLVSAATSEVAVRSAHILTSPDFTLWDYIEYFVVAVIANVEFPPGRN